MPLHCETLDDGTAERERERERMIGPAFFVVIFHMIFKYDSGVVVMSFFSITANN